MRQHKFSPRIESTLTRPMFVGANLYNARIEHSLLSQADFIDALFVHRDPDLGLGVDTMFVDSQFPRANCPGATLDEVTIERCSFSSANLEGASFERARLTRSF